MLYKKLENLEDRTNLPLNGPSNYRVVDNQIYTRALEINAVRQCNLSCRGCSHSAPIAHKKIYELEKLKHDLENVSKYLKCETIRIVGGEPLLYPNLEEFICVIKESKICEKICLVTNGLLLNKLNDNIINNLDSVEISLYPIDTKLSERIKEKAEELSLRIRKVRILEYSSFREPITKNKTNNIKLVNEVYSTCQVAHFYRCITIDNGRIYRCPQSMILSEKINDYSDSLTIDELKSFRDILLFLESNEPINSCSYCLGSVGKQFDHEQLNRNEWEEYIVDKPEEGIDYEQLTSLIEDAQLKNDCMNRQKIKK